MPVTIVLPQTKRKPQHVRLMTHPGTCTKSEAMEAWLYESGRAGTMTGFVTGAMVARTVRTLLILSITLSLGACFRPLYGPTASGESMQTALASIQVDEVATARDQERLGHYLRSELIFDLDGSGQPTSKRYRLKLQGSETVQTPIVSSTTARAEAGTLVGTVRYALINIQTDAIVTQGVATSTTTYDRSIQRFASLRAARDAEIRLAKVLAEQLKTRLASVLVARP